MRNFFHSHKNPVSVILALIVACGIFFYSKVQISMFPEITFPKIKDAAAENRHYPVRTGINPGRQMIEQQNGVVWEEPANVFVGIELVPHVREDADDVLETPEEMVRVLERLPRSRIAGIGLTANEIRLPRRDRRDTGNALDLALCRDRIGGLRR